MNNDTKYLFRLSAIAAGLMAIGSACASDEVTELTTPESSISVSAGQWSGERHQAGIYDGQRDGKAYGAVDFDVIKRDDETGTWFKLNGSNLGLGTEEFKAEWERQGDLGVSFEYNKTPHTNPYTFNTGLQGIGSANMAVSGATLGQFAKRDVTLETIREAYGLGFSKIISKGFDFKANFKSEQKTGTRPWGMGGQPYFVVEPIDSTTNQLDATANYSSEKLQVSLGYYGSQYINNISQVIVTNNGAAISAAGGNPANPQPLSVPLDNQAHQLFLNGSYAFTKDTKGSFKISHATATQNENLPVASNLIPFGPAATTAGNYGYVKSLDGRVDTTLVEGSLVSRVTPKFTLTANARYYDVNDKTPLIGVVGSNVTGIATVWNTPTSYKTQSGKLEGVYRLPQNYTLLAGIDYKQTDRSVPKVGTIYVPYRATTDETNYRLQVRKSMSESVNGSLAYIRSDRAGSPFIETTVATAGADLNYVNANSPFHLANRQRDKWRGTVDWTPAESLSLQFVMENSKDSYDLRNWSSAVAPFQAQGMMDGKASLYAVDASYSFSEKWKINGWYSIENSSARRMNYAATGGQKDTNLTEESQSAGLGLTGNVSSKWQLGSNMEWTYTVSGYEQNVAGVRQPLNDIKDRLTRVGAFAVYSPVKNHAVRFSYMHELWRTNDWTYQLSNGANFAYGTGTTDGTTVLSRPNQANDYLGVRYTYKF